MDLGIVGTDFDFRSVLAWLDLKKTDYEQGMNDLYLFFGSAWLVLQSVGYGA